MKIHKLLLLCCAMCLWMACEHIEKEPVSISTLQNEGRMAEALRRLRALSLENPDDLDARLRLAHGMILSGVEIEHVTNELDGILSISPHNHRALYLRFQRYMLNSQYNLAVDDISHMCNDYCETDTSTYSFLLADKADALLLSGDLNACKSHVRKALNVQITKETAYRLYVDNVFANLFLGHQDTAMWDVAFLPDRGFEQNDELMKLVVDSTLTFNRFTRASNFQPMELTWDRLNELFGPHTWRGSHSEL